MDRLLDKLHRLTIMRRHGVGGGHKCAIEIAIVPRRIRLPGNHRRRLKLWLELILDIGFIQFSILLQAAIEQLQ